MSDKRLEQYALDWASIMDGLQRKCEAEMDAAYKAGDPVRYKFPALLAGEIRSARQVMFGLLTFPTATPDPLPGRSCRHGITPDQCEFCDSPGADKEEATRQAIRVATPDQPGDTRA